MLGSFIAGRCAGLFGLTAMILAGRVLACAALVVGLVLFEAGFVNVLSLFGTAMLVGVGNGLTMPGCNAGALSVRPALAGSASGLSGALTVAGGAALSSIAGVIVSDESGPRALLGMMLVSSLLGLVAVVYVIVVARRGLSARPR